METWEGLALPQLLRMAHSQGGRNPQLLLKVWLFLDCENYETALSLVLYMIWIEHSRTSCPGYNSHTTRY
jgi:hypothetical protein